MWRHIVDALPWVNTTLMLALVGAFFRLSFQAGDTLRHVKDIDRRVERLENQQDKRVSHAYGD